MPEIPDEVYLSAALAQQKVWRTDEDPDWQRTIAERMAADPPFRVVVELAYQAGREDAARRVLDPLLRLRDIAELDKRGREQDGDREGVMCCIQYLDGLNTAINLLIKLGEDEDTPEGRR